MSDDQRPDRSELSSGGDRPPRREGSRPTGSSGAARGRTGADRSAAGGSAGQGNRRGAPQRREGSAPRSGPGQRPDREGRPTSSSSGARGSAPRGSAPRG